MTDTNFSKFTVHDPPTLKADNQGNSRMISNESAI